MPAAPGSIVVQAPLHAAWHYHVLAHLDMGRDAASIHDAALAKRPWQGALLAAWDACPGRLTLQFAGLWAHDERALLALLSGDRLDSLRDPTGAALREAMLAALKSERADFEGQWQRDWEVRQADVLAFTESLPVLRAVRAALWSRRGERPPTLAVWHVPALKGHGRAVSNKLRQVVATSLSQPVEVALCQVIHEQCHSISDPLVPVADPGVARDTRAGSHGHGRHLALERAAIALGAEVITQAAPELKSAYAAWRGRFPM